MRGHEKRVKNGSKDVMKEFKTGELCLFESGEGSICPGMVPAGDQRT